MDGQQGSASGYLEELPPPHPRNAHKDNQDKQGNENAIEHDVHLIHRNEASEHSRESRQQDGGMKLEKGFLHIKEQSRKTKAFRDCLDFGIRVRSRLR